MLNDAIKAYLADHAAEHLGRLKELLRFRSISAQSDHQGDCEACAQWLAEQFRGIGLEAEIENALGKPAVLAFSDQRPDRPTLLIYGHYDVQPADPLELWDSDPFEPTQRDGDLVARGVSDDKGPVMTWIAAAEAWRAVEGDFPVNLKFFIEGEEEVGSPKLEPFIADSAEKLACDYIAISDTCFFADGCPSITYGLRGLVFLEVKLSGPGRDLHSGLYGGIEINPLDALARLIAGLHDDDGHVTCPGFYDNVLPATDAERIAWEGLPFDEAAARADMGQSVLGGESGYAPLERLWSRPVLGCNGIWGGYTGEGPKTVVPAEAHAKLSARLVGNQDSHAVAAALTAYFQNNRPAGTKVAVTELSCEQPWLMPPDSPALVMARDAMAEAFEAPCTLIRCGASVPVTVLFHKHLGVHPLMMGYALPDDRVHSPNEKWRLDHFYRGIIASAALIDRLGASD